MKVGMNPPISGKKVTGLKKRMWKEFETMWGWLETEFSVCICFFNDCLIHVDVQ